MLLYLMCYEIGRNTSAGKFVEPKKMVNKLNESEEKPLKLCVKKSCIQQKVN